MRIGLLVVAITIASCGDNISPPMFATPIRLGLLPPTDAAHPFNNSVEPSIAARGGTVVVAFIDLHLKEGSFDFPADQADFRKQVATATSTDGGSTFAPSQQISHATFSTDPVIKIGATGPFRLSLLDEEGTFIANLYTAQDGATWTETVPNGPVGDKEWLAIDDASGRVYVASAGGFAVFGGDGSALGTATPGAQMTAAYVDAAGAHFTTTSDAAPSTVLRWDGVTAPTQEGDALSAGDAGTFFTTSSAAIGTTDVGAQWIVHGTLSVDGTAGIMLRVRTLPDAGSDLPISDPGAIAFLPAAAMDADGRLHVVYYDSSGGQGRLLYRRSRSRDLSAGFAPAVVVDSDACPPGFYPFYSTPMGGRRVREYIGLAIDGHRVHIAWTRATSAPSRVYVAHGDF